jgi:prevent-host-death family protein
MPTSKSRPVETIPAAEANRRFSELLRGVREEGRRYIVTSHGRAGAKVVPIDEADDEAKKAARREAHERLMEHLRAQPVRNLGKFNRDDAYDD